MKWLVLLFIIVPTAELALLIYSGNTIGLLPTITIILTTGIGGAYLAKKQGLKAWSEIRLRMSTMETPGDALIDGVCIFMGGLFLLMPGFITDIIGFLLLFGGPRNLIRPSIHKWIYKKMKNNQILMM
ncbi:FxsA family protein [Sporosarcina sp. FA9]|uniref:FxsA family protein n=1 Tax=Sporosarcina sp. FA9 TaxID=3413030 RepID=UPI003F65CBEC